MNENVFEAASAGHLDRLRALLAEDPDRANEARSDGHYPLGLAAFFGHADAVALLLDAGAHVDSVSQNAQRVSPLHGAAAGPNRVKIAALLLARGADVNAKQEGDYTPLHQAAHHGDVELIELLLAHGADRDARAADGTTPHDLAVKGGHADAAAALTRS